MKITFLNEAGVFGSYKNRNKESIANNTRREMAGIALDSIIEGSIDELANLYLDMLNDVNVEINKISSSKYVYTTQSGLEEVSNLLELSNFAFFRMSNRKKENLLNLIKNTYCNKLAIDYMISKGCFILPLVETKRRWSFFDDQNEIIPYKNMTKTVADTAEKIIKSHLSKFPSYASNIIPNKVKIVILQNTFAVDYTPSRQNGRERKLFSCMGIKNNNEVGFEYPVGQGSACLNYILDNYTILRHSCTIKLNKSNESIWKKLADPHPWMFNDIVLTSINTDISTISADNFYGIKILKFVLNNNMLDSEGYVNILIDNVMKNAQYISKLKQEISNNGLDHLVEYRFYDNDAEVESLLKIGKEITSKQAEQEGIDMNALKRRVYEFDYNDVAEVKSAAKNIIDSCSKFLTDDKIKKIAEDKMEEYLPTLMNTVLASRPNCVSSSDKILLCDYHQGGATGKTNLRVVIDTRKTNFNKKGNIEFYIAIEFKLPVIGVNPKYSVYKTGSTNHGKHYEFITGKKIKIEIPL